MTSPSDNSVGTGSPDRSAPSPEGEGQKEPEVFHIITQLREAGSVPARCGILLKLPDSLLFTYGGVLGEACIAANIPLGADFIRMRVALLTRVRDAHGLLPWGPSMELEVMRHTLSDVASGKIKLDEGVDATQ